MGERLGTFEHPHLAVDVVLLTLRDGALHALLVRRRPAPFGDHWVLPGGFVARGESVDAAVVRVLADKAGLHDVFVEQLFTFGDADRDPRGHVVSVAYYALVPLARLLATDRPDGVLLGRLDVAWRDLAGGTVEVRDEHGARLPVGFDHERILGVAVQRLRGKIDYAPVGFELLPRDFTLLQLQQVHEAVLGQRQNKDSFRRRMLASGQLQPTGRRERDVGHRPAELYRFRRPSRTGTGQKGTAQKGK